MFSPSDSFLIIIIVAAIVLTGIGVLATVIFIKTYLSRAEKISQSNSERSEFLANVGHELREPLHAIIGYSEDLMQKTSDESMRAELEKIYHSGKHVLALASDVLEIARIDAGRTRPRVETVNIADILKRVEYSASALLSQNNNTLEVEIGPKARVVSSDPVRIRQLLWNLISNAAKYTHNGIISVSVSREKDPRGSMLVIKVKDNGIGISREDQKRIFTSFVRADTDEVRKQEGTGLGLSIAKRICQMLGGELSVESELGKGSEFTAKVLIMTSAGLSATKA